MFWGDNFMEWRAVLKVCPPTPNIHSSPPPPPGDLDPLFSRYDSAHPLVLYHQALARYYRNQALASLFESSSTDVSFDPHPPPLSPPPFSKLQHIDCPPSSTCWFELLAKFATLPPPPPPKACLPPHPHHTHTHKQTPHTHKHTGHPPPMMLASLSPRWPLPNPPQWFWNFYRVRSDKMLA